ncbi:MAG: hypothetical protein RHS_5136 [Robinsoniella sp. RHS]|nr:MAG: hypothetical protein RHS_5136 [Robinsoniella sp. RHS]
MLNSFFLLLPIMSSFLRFVLCKSYNLYTNFHLVFDIIALAIGIYRCNFLSIFYTFMIFLYFYTK